MNLFVTDLCPKASAIALADRHVVKMAVETAQILSSAIRLRAPAFSYDVLYKPTHFKHPGVKWVADSRANADWAVLHGIALCEEYRHRYGRTHASLDVIFAADDLLVHIPDGRLTPFAQAMDDDLRQPDAVAAYRAYLNRKYASWGNMARWTNRNKPEWLGE